MLRSNELLMKAVFIIVLVFTSAPFGHSSTINGADQQVKCVSSTNTTCDFPGMASVELKCSGSSIEVGFNTTELDANILPYRIHFNESKCESVNKSFVNNTWNGRMWIRSNYSNCGILIEESGDDIIFHTTIIVEYGSKLNSKLIYRYFQDEYDLKCVLNKNITKELQLNVKNRKTIQTTKNDTAEIKLDFKVYKNDGEVSGLVYIGETLKFVLELPSSYTSVKASPQNCYATRLDGSGRYDLITNRCMGEDDTVKIVSKPNDTHIFAWDMLAFRYFGNSDGLYVTCDVLICLKNESNPNCQRCNAQGRKRRNIESNGIVDEEIVTTKAIFIVKRETANNNRPTSTSSGKSTSSDFLSKPEGTAVIVVLAISMFIICVAIVKKVFFSTGAAGVKTTVFAFQNQAME